MPVPMEATLKQGLPWRRGIPWWLVLVQGLLLVGIGLFLLVQPDTARSTVRVLIGAFLVFNGGLGIAAGFRPATRDLAMSPYRLLRGGIGLFAGLIVVLQPVFDYIDGDAARTVLAVGLLLWGLIGLYAAFATHEEGGLRWSTVIVSSLSVVFAVLIFVSARTGDSLVGPIGVAALVVGAVLLAYAYVLHRGVQTAAARPSPEAPVA